jgi:hypothetical protein
MGGEVHGDAGGEQAEGDGESAHDPRKLDASFEHEVVEDAEDENEHGGLCKEGRAAPTGDEDEIEPAWRRVLVRGFGFGLRSCEVNACRDVAEWGGALVVKHKKTFVLSASRMAEAEGEVQPIFDKWLIESNLRCISIDSHSLT